MHSAPSLFGCSLMLLAAAQLAPGQPVEQKFRATTRLVQFSVIAENEAGEPVAGLKGDDFTITDRGRPEKLALFSQEDARRNRPAPPVPAGTFTNRFEHLGGAPTGVTAVLFDGLNTNVADQAFARQQIVRFLEQLQPGDRVAVYVMGRGPRVIQDFTDEPGALVAALRDYQGEQRPSLDAPLYDPAVTPAIHLNAWLGELGFNLVDHFDRDRAFRTVRAITAIARHLERLPGRKNLIWVSGSFPVSIGGGTISLPARAARGSQSGWPETERLARALNRANVAIYPVDARGLIAPQEYRASSAVVSEDNRLRDQQTFSTMRILAERTGGRAFYQNNDLTAAFRWAAADAGLSYLLGYYPSHDEWNGRFREVTIQVNRPGVRVHHRRGYFALPDEPRESWYREETFEAAMFSPLEASGVGLTVRVSPGSAGVLDLDLGLDARNITFEPRAGVWECGVDVWLIQMDLQERRLKTEARTTRLRLNQLEYQRVMQAQGLRLVEQVKPSRKALLVRVMVRDVASGGLGSVTIPVRRYLDER